MDLMALIKDRRTVRVYKNENVPDSVIESIVEAGIWAPSAHNFQPWRFVAITNKKKIEEIVMVLNNKANELYSGFNIIMRDTAKHLAKVPVLIAVYSDKSITAKFERFGAPYSEMSELFENQSLSAAIQNILLYVHSIGLGGCWYGMPILCEQSINTITGFSGKLLALLSVGVPDEKPIQMKRKPLKEVLTILS